MSFEMPGPEELDKIQKEYLSPEQIEKDKLREETYEAGEKSEQRKNNETLAEKTKEKDAAFKALELDKVEPRDPWYNKEYDRVDRYNPAEAWENLYNKTLEKWEENVLKYGEVPSEMTKIEQTENEMQQRIESNIKTILENELLRSMDGLLKDKSLDRQDIELIMQQEKSPIGKEGLASEMHVKQKLVEKGAQLCFGYEQPTFYLNEEKMIGFIENESPGFFKGKYGEKRLTNLKSYMSLCLKGFAAVAYGKFSANPGAYNTEPAGLIKAMTDLSFDLNKYYDKKPNENDVQPSKDDIILRTAEIQRKLDFLFGETTNTVSWLRA